MKDVFGNTKPVQIEVNEWWFNSRIIVKQEDFRQQLSNSFFSHRFIKSFLENLDLKEEIYFGTAKEWIHKNCADVPTPRKWKITENIQILYRWIVKLGDGKYQVDRPNYSERLFRVK